MKAKIPIESLLHGRKLAIFITLSISLLITIPLYSNTFSSLSTILKHSRSCPATSNSSANCDLFHGEWIPNPNAPYYNNAMCGWAIFEHQNCVKYGRPDTEFVKWRWKPHCCELEVFDPEEFLEIVRGKSMTFIGDSVGRNQMQSLMCLLSRIANPEDVSLTADYNFRTWLYRTYNFKLAYFYSPYLVHGIEDDPKSRNLSGLYNLHLDEPDSNWTTQIQQFDYVIVSAGHWFFRPLKYFENRRLVGCHSCNEKNVPKFPASHGYRMAFRTAFRTLNNIKKFKGMVFLRTISPSHFENGAWNDGGTCVRTKPFKSNEIELEGITLEMYKPQVEEFKAAEKEGRKRGLKYRLLDTTEAMLLRPDGHPDRYGKIREEFHYNDCVHWCLPGPIDAWNDLLQHILMLERRER